MENRCSLTKLQVGENGEVDVLRAKPGIRRRLRDLGLIEGTHVECVLKSPGGDPMAYCIRGAVIAIRNDDAGDIIVCVR